MKLKKIDTPKGIKQELLTPFPQNLIQTKPDKNKSKYIPGETVIDKLNATFGFLGWDWEILDKWIEQSTPKVIKTRYENGTSISLPQNQWRTEPQNPVAHVIGKLTVRFEKEDGSIYTVTRTAPGSHCITGGQSEQESCFKAAHTDALKKAATSFGIALELYRKKPAQLEYFQIINYENPWTEEEQSKHKEDFEYINKFMNIFKLDMNGINQLVVTYFNGSFTDVNYITPECLTNFVNYLKDMENKTSKSNQEKETL